MSRNKVSYTIIVNNNALIYEGNIKAAPLAKLIGNIHHD
jgi:hypothetical protein